MNQDSDKGIISPRSSRTNASNNHAFKYSGVRNSRNTLSVGFTHILSLTIGGMPEVEASHDNIVPLAIPSI